MQNSDESSSSFSNRRRGHLPPLAPRNVQASSRGDRSNSSSGRPARLSHRSRAGCWTCRGRKVKCDEVHPRCGPCTRLNRECDWDHRWNFSDATINTKTRYTNVTTEGNAVWDPSARSSPGNSPITRIDDLPAFSTLQNDDDRERKAETQLPGTFRVVVTPESFSDLPEYSNTASPNSRRMSVQSGSSHATPSDRTSSLSRSGTRAAVDPTTVVLDRFEDASPSAGSPFANLPPSRRPSLPESMYYLAINTSPPGPPPTIATATATQPQSLSTGNSLISRFQHYIVQRLCQPMPSASSPGILIPTSTKDMFELEAQMFPPLHHAICAISSLNLAYGRSSTLEVAMEHYHSALSAGTPHDDILSDGVFLRHFLLLVYDICLPMSDDSNMWADHMGHLQRIATARHQQLGHEPRGFIIWRTCELDTYASLMGHGSCEFVRHVLTNGMLPALDQQIPVINPAAPFAPNEVAVFPAILTLRQNVMIHTAKLAQLAQNLRIEAASRQAVSSDAYARWTAAVNQTQTELTTAWVQSYPDFLPPESPEAGRGLPIRIRYVFEQAYLLYQAATIYSRTSMFPQQRRLGQSTTDPDNTTQADTERRIIAILTLTSSNFAAGHQDAARHSIFPLFMAGFATLQPDAKIQTLETIAAMEGTGIGKNTSQTRALLKAVFEEQRMAYERGGSVGEVDWLDVARGRRLWVVNCGL